MDNPVVTISDLDWQNTLSDIITIVSKKPRKVFGHSYNSDGEIIWQFSIISNDGLLFEIQLYSWISGDENGTSTVTSRFLRDECRLYFSERAWLKAGGSSDEDIKWMEKIYGRKVP